HASPHPVRRARLGEQLRRRSRARPRHPPRVLRPLRRPRRRRAGHALRRAHRGPHRDRRRRLALSARDKRGAAMIIPLTLADFLERAELVYAHREAVVDEPDPPGGGLGRVTYAAFGAMARSLAAALDDLGVGQSERVAIVSPNAARFLV